MTNKIRDLYKKSLKEKWDRPMGSVSFFSYCPFCDDVIQRDDGDIIDLEGDDCGNVCLIDKNICGSEGSLLSKIDNYINDNNLRDYTYSSFTLNEEGLNDKKLIGMFKDIQKLMKKHARKKLRLRS